MRKIYELTILMPCLNEEKTLAGCINNAKKVLKANNLNGEILIVDNGSSDSSMEIAKNMNVRVIKEYTKGYGAALKKGCMEASGEYVIMLDSDGTYDFNDLPLILDKLRLGYDLVVGNRFKGGIEKGAMPLNRYIGNYLLSFIGKVLFRLNINDFHCGLRGYNKRKMINLNLVSNGMEYASEMIVKASQNGFKVIEVPVKLLKNGRNGNSHLRPFRDGFRHLYLLINLYFTKIILTIKLKMCRI